MSTVILVHFNKLPLLRCNVAMARMQIHCDAAVDVRATCLFSTALDTTTNCISGNEAGTDSRGAATYYNMLLQNILKNFRSRVFSNAEQRNPLTTLGSKALYVTVFCANTASSHFCKELRMSLSLQSHTWGSSPLFLALNGKANSAINPLWYITFNFHFKLHLSANGSLIPAVTYI